MDNFDENDIGTLLRLKKYEQPPPGYFENFLHEFHRRQRDELLRQPVWSVMWQRLSDSLFRFNIPSLTSYPSAVAAVLVCAAVVSLKIYQAPQATDLAMVESAALTSHRSVIDQMSTERVPDVFTLSSPLSSRSLGPDLSRQVNESAYTHRASTPPRYVLDRLPVSYEPSFNF
ncbi:MAG: hypothetical protein M3Q86_08445 [Verrucomicrobiota bacterium]|nr:hypothetical protein [Verrucomicrobiota bacterium]